MKSFERSFRNLNFSPSTSILLNFFFPVIDITCFFVKYKTSVLSSNRQMLKKLRLFLAKKNASCPKAPRNFPPRKEGILYPVGLSWDSPPPPTESVRTDVRTYGHVTITSQPKFLGLTGYQISSAMELSWWALPAGSA